MDVATQEEWEARGGGRFLKTDQFSWTLHVYCLFMGGFKNDFWNDFIIILALAGVTYFFFFWYCHWLISKSLPFGTCSSRLSDLKKCNQSYFSELCFFYCNALFHTCTIFLKANQLQEDLESWFVYIFKSQADYRRLKEWDFLRKIIGKVTNLFKSSCICFCMIYGNETHGYYKWQYVYSGKGYILTFW